MQNQYQQLLAGVCLLGSVVWHGTGYAIDYATDGTRAAAGSGAHEGDAKLSTGGMTALRPNIVFIFSDDHAISSIGAYEGRYAPYDPTPNIDRLADEGMRFDRCYVTNSICGPSRATILTGKYPHLNGYYKNDLYFDGSQQTFPKLLQDVGYQTAVIGKWHLHSVPTGFDHYEILTGMAGQGQYYSPTLLTNGESIAYSGYTTDIITQRGLRWLKEAANQEQPFLLMLQHKAPHRSWQPSPEHYDLYADVTFPEPETFFDDFETRGTAARTQLMSIVDDMSEVDLKLKPPYYMKGDDLNAWHEAYDAENEAFHQAELTGDDLARWKYQRYVRGYLRTAAAMDDSIGEVLDYLEESGLAENTIVVYGSDQGFYLGEHGWFDKRFMYEESLRAPLLVRWPGVTQAGSVEAEAIVSNLDFAQTFLDAARATIPSDMQGRSLKPVLAGEVPHDWRQSFYYHYYGYPDYHMVRQHYGVTDGRYKLIHFYTLGEKELYDLKTDPHEVRNVYVKPGYEAITERLENELARLRTGLEVPEDQVVAERFKGFEKENPYIKSYLREIGYTPESE